MLIHDQQSISNAVVHENRFSLCCESQLSWFSFGQIYGTKLYMSYPHIVIIIVFLFKSQPVLVPSMVTVNVSCTAGSHDRNPLSVFWFNNFIRSLVFLLHGHPLETNPRFSDPPALPSPAGSYRLVLAQAPLALSLVFKLSWLSASVGSALRYWDLGGAMLVSSCCSANMSCSFWWRTFSSLEMRLPMR